MRHILCGRRGNPLTGIDSYSTTPATNATFDGGSGNWAEGQAPSSVNGTARQMLADIRAQFNDASWFQYGSGDQNSSTHLALPCVYASGTTFTIAGVDVTTYWHVNRRIRAVGSGTGTIYGRISASAFSTNTTVTAVWDSGSLSNETLVISASTMPVTGLPVAIAGVSGYVGATSWTPADGSGAGLTFSSVSVNYTKVGNLVFIYGRVTYPVTADATAANISGLPFASANAVYASAIGAAIDNSGAQRIIKVTQNASTFGLVNNAGSNVTNANLSTLTLSFSFFYPIA